MRFYLSPSDQTGNLYAVGNTNEAEQCRQICTLAVKALERQGVEAMTNLTASMKERVKESDEWGADVHVPVHTNAYNGEVAGTRIFCYETGGEGNRICVAVMKRLAPITPGISDGISARPELYECREANAPTVYIEIGFHDNPEEAQWIIDHKQEIAEAIAHGLCDAFGVEYTEPGEFEPDEIEELKRRVEELTKLVDTLKTAVGMNLNDTIDLMEAMGVRYDTLGDVRADEEHAEFYLPTLERLIEQGHLRGKGGAGDDLILDLSEDAVRLLVVLDRAGVFGK
jgi:N-acetylmuramoyl-L-alanine amidase